MEQDLVQYYKLEYKQRFRLKLLWGTFVNLGINFRGKKNSLRKLMIL